MTRTERRGNIWNSEYGSIMGKERIKIVGLSRGLRAAESERLLQLPADGVLYTVRQKTSPFLFLITQSKVDRF